MMTAAQNTPMDKAPVIDFDKFKPTRSFIAARKRKDMAMRVLIVLAFVIALIPLISVLWTTISNGIKRFNLDFLSHNMTATRPRPAATAACSTPSSARWKSRWAPWSSRSRSA